MEKREESNILAEKKNIDLSVRILLLVVLFAWCMMIILPFVIPVLWGLILSITLYPLYKGLLNLLKGKKILAAAVTTGILLLVLIVPMVWIIASVVESAGNFITSLRNHELVIPAPRPSVAGWPLIGEPVYNTWLSLTTNLEDFLMQHNSEMYLKKPKWLLTNFDNRENGIQAYDFLVLHL